MKLTFFGAARAVTGKLPLCGVRGKEDSGGRAACSRPGRAGQPGAGLCRRVHRRVVVTHAHIDHSGRIPLLVKQGFTGNIYCTRLTGQLLSIMLRDSAHIQESDAQWQNQKGKRAGEEPVEPLYTVHDAEEAVKRIVTCEYGTTLQIADGVKVRFVDAGHLLGSASVEMWLTEGTPPARWSSPATSATGISPSSATPSTSGTPTMCSPRAPTATGSTTWTSSRTTPPTWPPLLTRLWAMGAT